MLCKFIIVFAFTAIVASGRIVNHRAREDEVHASIVQICTKNGAQDQINVIEAKWNTFGICILDEIDLRDLEELQRATPDDSPQALVNFTRKMCTKKTQLENCVINMIDTVLPCVDPALQGNVDSSKKALQDFGNYVCKDKAKIISNLLQEDAMQCFNDKTHELRSCMEKIDIIENMSLLTTSQICQLYNDMEKCLVDKLKQCRNLTFANFVERFLDTLAAGSKCDNSTISVNRI